MSVGDTGRIGDGVIAAGAVTLRPWAPEDVVFVYDACQDAEVQRWTLVPRPYTAGDAVAFLELSALGRVEDAWAFFAITATDTGELLGSIGLKEIEWDAGRAEGGYWVAPEARGRGAATAALAGLTAWAFEALGLREVWLQVARGNEGSQQVAVRAGFQADGVIPGGARDGDDLDDSLLFRRFAPA